MKDTADRANEWEEAEYLERCRTALNETGSSWYYQSGEDWLWIPGSGSGSPDSGGMPGMSCMFPKCLPERDFTLRCGSWPPYSRNEEAYDHYQIRFVFDENVGLVRIGNTVFFLHETEGDYSTKETFRIVDYGADLAILQEYQRYINAS